MDDVTIEAIEEEMYQMVLATEKAKVLTPSDLVQTMMAKYRDRGVKRKDCKMALRQLIESGKCVYGYYVDTYVTVPQEECSAAPARKVKEGKSDES